MRLIWKGAEPERAVVEKVIAELRDLDLMGLGKPSDLITHSVFMDDLSGPSVHVYGEGDAYHCEYIAESKWVTLDGRPAEPPKET